MSRTKRLKNSYYPKRGRETYAVGEWISKRLYYPFKYRPRLYWDEISGEYKWSDWYQPWITRNEWVLIDPSDRKRYGKALHARHKESSSANDRTPGRAFRKRREHEYRRDTAIELHRFLHDPDYEVMLANKPKSHLWDWR